MRYKHCSRKNLNRGTTNLSIFFPKICPVFRKKSLIILYENAKANQLGSVSFFDESIQPFQNFDS